jgi:hypothetical protein
MLAALMLMFLVSFTYLEGEAGVERLEAALARILEAELERLPSCTYVARD